MADNFFEGLTINTTGLTVEMDGPPESTMEVIEAEDGTKVPVSTEPRAIPRQSPRVSFPDRPGQTYDYMELSSSAEPRVERRWFRLQSAGIDHDYLWYGPCLYCAQSVWALADRSTTSYLSDNQALEIIERDGREYRFCRQCATRDSRVNTSIEANQNEFTGPYVWPEETIAKIMGRPEWVRNRMLGEVVPVVPRHGALVRVKSINDNERDAVAGRLLHFDKFEDGMVVTMDGSRFAVDEVEALTPAHPGIAYERATAMPASGSPGQLIAIRSWRGKDPTVQVVGQTRVTAWNSQHTASLSPVLDPTTETPQETIARLTRERDRVEHGMHARMVAEGVARSWCSEFDMILDITGLPPRQVRNMVTGTMTFSQAIPGDVTEDVLVAIKRRWRDHIRVENITVVEVKHLSDERMPLITPA